MQARVSGWVDERYVLAANGAAVPLTRTDREGEYVGGVRFKAWNPPSALHPTIGVHAPLVLDVFDRWSERSVGGMTYHISHPGGRSYDTLAGECERGGGPAAVTVLPVRPHPRADARAGGAAVAGASQDAGSAAGLVGSVAGSVRPW